MCLGRSNDMYSIHSLGTDQTLERWKARGEGEEGTATISGRRDLHRTAVYSNDDATPPPLARPRAFVTNLRNGRTGRGWL